MDLPSFSDIFRIGRSEMLVRNGRISPEEIDRRGSDINNLVASSAAMADACMGQLASVRAALYVGTARKDDLDRLITDRYPDLVRKQAAPSYGYVTFSFSPAVVTLFSIPDATVLSTADNVQFITVGATPVPHGTTTIRVPIRSVLAGSTQKAAIGKINSVLGNITGAPTGMTVTNESATFGGEDREEDADYAVRYTLHYLAARRATIGAIEQAVLSVPGIVKATVFENLDTSGRPVGYVQVVVADSYTEQFVVLASPPAAYMSQLANLTTQISNVLLEWRAAGVGVVVQFASIVLQTIRVSLAYVAGADTTAVNAVVLAKLIQYTNNLRPGQTFSLDEARRLVSETSGVYYTGNEIVSPTGDVVPLPGQVLRTSTSFTTVG